MDYQYRIFKTHQGYFGLLGSRDYLYRSCLPMSEKQQVCNVLFQNSHIQSITIRENPTGYQPLIEAIKAYYKGNYIEFSQVERPPLYLKELTGFQQKVLKTLLNVGYGCTISYKQLARKAGSPSAARAVGSVMRANPLPLLIPCHRVIHSDGRPGQFSAAGGIAMKQTMLQLEKAKMIHLDNA